MILRSRFSNLIKFLPLKIDARERNSINVLKAERLEIWGKYKENWKQHLWLDEKLINISASFAAYAVTCVLNQA